ncbi:hypothetical protein AJ80_00075 [Polytolypa hystricis UAMH7299]|uniref:Uncharacterized protein n=1 Tax=Polytolypa hystricis (strain UAMH7299) TaxID=1447883 RepID=A0A2B7Z3K8_POLH7|nr:hypothetical protein AJ80_00075 [Polytolypa hystricis UAMH7299]
MLPNLPLEIILHIIKTQADWRPKSLGRRELKRLCEVCKDLYNIAAPMLYELLVIRAPSEFSIERTDVQSLLSARHQPRFVKSLQFISEFHGNVKSRCPHPSGYELPDEDSDDEDDDSHDHEVIFYENDNFGLFANNILSLLERIEDDGLQSFAWDLGSCVPEKILGPDGYLARKQSKLESIRLITDGTCFTNEIIILETFQHLKRLSWIDIRLECHFDSLRNTLQQISPQLEELELDLVKWSAVEESAPFVDEALVNYFLMGITPEVQTRIFPALRKLSLSSVSLRPMEKEFLSALNRPQLCSLKLRLCDDWEAFLEHAIDSKQQVNLKSLEIHSAPDYDLDYDLAFELEEDHILPIFLNSFDGLEELFIHGTAPLAVPDLWRAALHHKSTLRKFVHHRRAINNDDNSRHYDEAVDCPDLSFVLKICADLSEEPGGNTLAGLDLECLGTCCHPEYLKPIIAPLRSERSLEVLHIRQSGTDLRHYVSWGLRDERDKPRTYRNYRSHTIVTTDVEESNLECATDALSSPSKLLSPPSLEKFLKITAGLHDFAQWIFGPRGIRSVRVVAVGDFLYNGRYDATNLQELLHKYADVLGACPTDPILNYSST